MFQNRRRHALNELIYIYTHTHMSCICVWVIMVNKEINKNIIDLIVSKSKVLEHLAIGQ